jgi:hypothetical protein
MTGQGALYINQPERGFRHGLVWRDAYPMIREEGVKVNEVKEGI